MSLHGLHLGIGINYRMYSSQRKKAYQELGMNVMSLTVILWQYEGMKLPVQWVILCS
jgi:hypothetical protein